MIKIDGVKVMGKTHNDSAVAVAALVNKHGLDRRRVYGNYADHLCFDTVVTVPCPDCRESDGEYGGVILPEEEGGGDECGFTGKRRERTPDFPTIDGNMILVEA